MSSSSVLNMIRRDLSSSTTTSGATVPLLIALLVLTIVGFSLGGVLYLIRRHRRRSQLLPTHITVTSVPYRDEKSNPSSPTTPKLCVPEIRITFPEEEGADGKRKSGRVVVVQVGEAGAAFVRDVEIKSESGTREDGLPSYYNSPKKSEFDSVDLDQVGGLKEKYDWA